MAIRLQVAEVARQKKGWNMRQLAQELELDHMTVMYWNQGRSHPRLPTLWKLCRLLGCSLEELVVEEFLQAGPQDFENEAGNILENIPVTRPGHAPQIVTSHHGRMGSV